jgi:putative ABC transport system ATP-binding protein
MTTCLSCWLSEAKLWVGIIEKRIPITRHLKKNVRSSLYGLFFMARNVLLVEGLRKVVPTAAGELVILDGIDLEINDGESVAIVGASGSGKTTLLGILAGLDTATSGLVKLMDSEISGMDEEARAVLRGQHVGFVFQSFQLLTSLTALENVMLPVELRGDALAQDQAVELLEKVGLADRLDHYPRQLSGGEQQRVAIARAFASRPTILFADEPTGNLDTANGEKIIDLLFDLNSEFGTTIVLVTHESRLADRCSRTIKLTAGKVDR